MKLDQSPDFPNIYLVSDGGILVYSDITKSNKFDFSTAFTTGDNNYFTLVFYQNKSVTITEDIVTDLRNRHRDNNEIIWVDNLGISRLDLVGITFKGNKVIDFGVGIGNHTHTLLVDGSLARELTIGYNADKEALEFLANEGNIVVTDLVEMRNEFDQCFIPLTHDKLFSESHKKNYGRGSICFGFSLKSNESEQLEHTNNALIFQPKTALIESKGNRKKICSYTYLDNQSLWDGTCCKMSVYPIQSVENSLPAQFSSYLLMNCPTGTRTDFVDEMGIQYTMDEPHALMSRLTFINTKKSKSRRDFFFSPLEGEQLKISTANGKYMLLGNSGTERVDACILEFRDYTKVLFDENDTDLGKDHEGSLTSVLVLSNAVKHYLDAEHAPYFRNLSTKENSLENEGKVESEYAPIQIGRLGLRDVGDQEYIVPLIPTLAFRRNKSLEEIENLLVRKRLDTSNFFGFVPKSDDSTVITPQGFTKVANRLDFIKTDDNQGLESATKTRFTIKNIDTDFSISIAREDVFFVTTPKLLKQANNFIVNFDIFFDVQGFGVDLNLGNVKDEDLVDDNRIIIFKYSRHTLDYLINDTSKWSNYGSFGASNKLIDLNKIQEVVQNEFDKFDKKYKEENTKEDYRYIQDEIRHNRGWNGVLILNIPIENSSLLPTEFDGLLSSQHLKQDDNKINDGKLKLETPLRFEYVAIPVNKTYVNNGKIDIESTVFYGLIDYDVVGTWDDRGLDFDEVNKFFRRSGDISYRFALSKLLIRFENSEFRNFISYAFVKVHNLFEDDVTFEGVELSNASKLLPNVDPERKIKNLFRLDGSIQTDSYGRNIFRFNLDTGIKVEFGKNDIIETLVLTKASFANVEGASDVYRFDLDANVQFSKNIGNMKDLLHIESLLLKNIGLKFDKKDVLPDIKFDESKLQFFPKIKFNGKGLLGSFPIKFNRFQVFQIDKTGLLDYDFSSVYSKELHGSSMWSMVFDFDLGTLGDLAAFKMLKGELLVGWTKDGGLEVGFKLNGPSKKGVNVDFGPFQLSIERFDLCTFEAREGTSYLMRLVNARMKIYTTELPPKDAFDFNGIIYAQPRKKLAWFIAATKKGTVEAPGNLVLGVGQRVGPKVETMDRTVESLINKALDVFSTNLDPCSTGNPVNDFYEPKRNWFLGSNDFIPSGWRKIFDMQFVFNDPDLYGIHLELKKIIDFDILYKKLSDKLGVYSLEFELPPEFRNIEAGGIAWTLPNLGVDIFTNGDFKIDIGYPRKSGDWSRSCLMQLRPFVGWVGFYITRLRTASLSLFGKYQSEVEDCLILQTGMAFRVGLGGYIDKGVFYVGASISVYGILEGAFAFKPDEGALDQFLPDHFALAGRVGAIAELVGYINFRITKVSVHVILRVEFGLTLYVINGKLQEVPMYIEGSVRVRVRFTISCFKIFRKKICIRVTLSYHSRVRFNYILGKGGNNLLALHGERPFTIDLTQPVSVNITDIPVIYIPTITTVDESQRGTTESYLIHQFAINFFGCCYNEKTGALEYAAKNVLKDRIITPIFEAVFTHALGEMEEKVMDYKHLRAYFLEGPHADNVEFKIRYRPVLLSGYGSNLDEKLLTDHMLYDFDNNEFKAFQKLLENDECTEDSGKCPFRPIPIPVSRHMSVRRKDQSIPESDSFTLRWEGILNLEGGNEKEFTYKGNYSESDLATLDKQFDKYFTQFLDRSDNGPKLAETKYDLNEDLVIAEYFKFIGLVTLETYMEYLIEQKIDEDIENPKIQLKKLLEEDGDWKLNSDERLGAIIGRLNYFYNSGLRLTDVLGNPDDTKSYFDLLGQTHKINGIVDGPEEDIDIIFTNSHGSVSLKDDVLGFGADSFKEEVHDKINLNLDKLKDTVLKSEISNPFELVPVVLPVSNSTIKVESTRYFELPVQIRNDQSRNKAFINLRISDNENRSVMKIRGQDIKLDYRAVVQVELSARVQTVSVDGVQKVKSLEFVDTSMDAVNLLHRVHTSQGFVKNIHCYFKKEEKNKPTEYIDLITGSNQNEIYLVKTNLSPKTHPPVIMDQVNLFTNNAINYTASVSNIIDFVRILWEASVTNNGGYFLTDFSESEIFNSVLLDVKDQIQLVFSFEAAPNTEFISYSNYIRVDEMSLGDSSLFEALDKGSHSLFTELMEVDSKTPVLEYQPTIPSHCFALHVERQNNEFESDKFEQYLPLEYSVSKANGEPLLSSDEVLPIMPQSPQSAVPEKNVTFGSELLIYKHVSPISEVKCDSQPYRYKHVGKKFNVQVGLRDVFGFRATSLGEPLTLIHRYFDKLEPVSSWPYIKLSYWLDKVKDGKLIWKLNINVFEKGGKYEKINFDEALKKLLLIQDQINEKDSKGNIYQRIRFSMEGFSVSEDKLRREMCKAVDYALDQLVKNKTEPEDFGLEFETPEIMTLRTVLAPSIMISRESESEKDFFVQVPDADKVWGVSEIKSTRFTVPLRGKEEGTTWKNLDDILRKESKGRYTIGLSSGESKVENTEKFAYIIDTSMLTFEVTNKQPLSRKNYFGLVPYSTQKWNGTYKGNIIDGKIDLDQGLRLILAKIDQLLTPEGLSGFRREEIKSHIEKLIQSKKILVEEELHGRVDNIDNLNANVSPEMQEELRKILLEKANYFYEYDGMITVELESDYLKELEEYRLLVGIPQVPDYNLVSSKLDCRNGVPSWTIMFDQIGSSKFIELDFTPKITHLEFDIDNISGEKDVEKSTWIQLLQPVDLPKINTNHTNDDEDKWPRIYREFPPNPHLKKHYAKQEFGDTNKVVWKREIGQWSYIMHIDDTEYDEGTASQYFPGDVLRIYLSTRESDHISPLTDVRDFEGFIAYWSIKFSSKQKNISNNKDFIIDLYNELTKPKPEELYESNTEGNQYFELTKSNSDNWTITHKCSPLFEVFTTVERLPETNLKVLKVKVTSKDFNVLGEPKKSKIRSIRSEAEAYRNTAVKNKRFQYVTNRSVFSTWVTPHITFFNSILNESLHESVFKLFASLNLPYKVTSKWLIDTHDLNVERNAKLPVIPIEQMEFDASKTHSVKYQEEFLYDKKFEVYDNGYPVLSITLYDHSEEKNKVDRPLLTIATIFRNKTKETISFTDNNGQKVILACEKHWETNKGDCNAFVKAVAKEFGIILTGQADNIVDQIKGPAWIKLGKDGLKAKKKAEEGWLVIGALRSEQHNPPREHGHVVVVVEGAVAHGKYPRAYWGSLGGKPHQNETINYSWRKADRDNVIYAAIKID
ncbi:hypothetical protein [Algivirga pacifica]|uniref:Uncharacterized protein n=1 Tax=Algivirga pacifica TaxID=1162670 RepID=A0ABP9DLE6_9BACT